MPDELVFVYDDDADTVVELDMKMAGGEAGGRDFDVADIFDGPGLRAIYFGHRPFSR
ncbi:hypothetical protein GCM10007100_40530 [Roseibacillus persicicus]|uniref:Uncharacterized protein n=1 Tax=Roseibacillus persicicus TaxID=454148 RepID=A0A918WQQ1_9BACT|nr:hypothetical protein GCM10007100_40530 [Roseibacillus persicicus]